MQSYAGGGGWLEGKGGGGGRPADGLYGVSQPLLGHTSGELPAGWASSVLQGKTYYYCESEHPLGGKPPPSQWNVPAFPCELPAGWASSVLQGKTYYYCSAEHPLGGSLPPSQEQAHIASGEGGALLSTPHA